MSIGSDSGLEMDVTGPFPVWMLRAHGGGACLLVLLTLLQKESVRRMAADAEGATALHRRVGYCCLAALAVMDGAGYALGSGYSKFEGFGTFVKFFAAPFALWLVGIWLSAAAGWLRTHALLGNMLLKGCIATPLSRLGGATMQRLGWSTAAGYYQGIFGVACVIGVWQLADLAEFARAAREARRSD